MEKRSLKNQLYYSKRNAWKYTFVCIILSSLLLYIKTMNYILFIIPFLISAFVSLIHEIGNVNEYSLKLSELEEN